MLEEKSLQTYLSDHLAGSVVAIELIERCQKENTEGRLGEFLPRLLADIRDDQDVLKDLLRRLDSPEPSVKKAMAWLSEKALRLKPQGEPLGYSPLALLEDLEILALGIRGKLGLWTVLQKIAAADERLYDIDFADLGSRARQQHDEVESFRQEAALQAFLRPAD
ncbi:MAG: hypothetical protein IH614_19925 [Desulfuromonadales bacterium]|nr:hypothetical protein [Desulfuromonadales bacterium]